MEIGKFFILFLGLPLRPSALGRAVSQLAVRSALRFFSLRSKN
ncbi:hypothetical protein SGRA_0929 [Saprospira grandis str. Lewin]|uniref:Uncharacterized protein n=1 Tax=Saprospira grandis (strain Lewin) TaxID=984262 RepID=H6L2K7_SAPGL|nr:hypothetical protein SGRA_0929 [Saprospira grandis str. Lewin]